MSVGLSMFTIELKKKLSYRVDFWLHLVGSLAAQFGVAYFLWRAVFEVKQVSSMQGYSFNALMLYYILVSIITHLVRGPRHGYISRDIYEGGLNRYLVYPVDFFYAKYMGYLGSASFYIVQLLLVILACIFFIGVPVDVPLRLENIILGILFACVSATLYFLCICALELVAFWSDQVWGLLEMLRMVSVLLGGALIPLAFFPEWAQSACYASPFPYLFAYPVETMLGKHELGTVVTALFISVCWCLCLAAVVRTVWLKGLRQYTGIGM